MKRLAKVFLPVIGVQVLCIISLCCDAQANGHPSGDCARNWHITIAARYNSAGVDGISLVQRLRQQTADPRRNGSTHNFPENDTARIIAPAGNALPADKRQGQAHAMHRFWYLGIIGVTAGAIASLTRRRYDVMKRAFDIVTSIIILSIFLPLLAACALLITCDSPGPIFYKQTRVGINRRRTAAISQLSGERRESRHFGRPFTIYKLRTMCVDAETSSGPVWARENDERITRVGRFLRKTRLDELPQFINVLKGDMCIIGPRPERPVFINQLNDVLPDYDKRLQIKPGITGLAQVRYQYAATIEDARKKLRYDLLYVRKKCFLLDVGILLGTFSVVLSAKGAR